MPAKNQREVFYPDDPTIEFAEKVRQEKGLKSMSKTWLYLVAMGMMAHAQLTDKEKRGTQ